MRKRFIILLVAVAVLFIGSELERQAVASEGSGQEVFDVVQAADGLDQLIESTVGGWAYVSPMPTPRMFLAAAESGGKIYAVGGMLPNHYVTNVVEAYDPQTDTWSTKSPMPTLRCAMGVAVADGKIYVIGGYAQGYLSNRLEVYDPQTDTWSIKSSMPTSRDFLGAAAVAGKIYAIGGGRSVSNGHLVQMYDPQTNSWSTKSPMPTSRYAMGITVADGKIYTIGGGLVWTATATTTVEVYDPQTNSWSTKSPIPGPRYRLAAVTGPDGMLYAIGGSDGGGHLVNKVQAYDPKTDTWSSAPYLPSQRWDLAAAVGPNSTIYAIGGYSYNPYGCTNTVLAYSPVRIVSIDIKPGSDPNSINLGSQGNVPVAIFSTPDFDATNIDPLTVTLAGASVKLKGKGTPMTSFEDINEDGLLDIVVHVDTTAFELSLGDTDAVLEGETYDGVCIKGTDTVRIVND
ncbi:MAG: hypothetical protein JSW00_06570 [Thermoplasmata archaeon]|nr:MAG: hypothetical protein JSW00_06570 [Thermoplasmata archaeon]